MSTPTQVGQMQNLDALRRSLNAIFELLTASGPSTARPPALFVGQPYFDTTRDAPVWWDGSQWVGGSGGGGGAITSTHESASFTTTSAFNCYFLDTSAGACTVTLNATPALNEVAEVWDRTGHAGSNPVSFNGNGNTIAGAATLTNFIAINYGHARLIWDGTQWLLQ